MNLKKLNGRPIINAKRPLFIQVTEADIKKADRKDPECCAMAVACKRQLKAKEVAIHLGRVYLRFNDKAWLRFMTPADLRINIIVFDRGGKFEGGEYRLGPVTPSKRATGKRQGSAKDKPGRPRKKRAYHFAENVRSGPASSARVR